MAQPGGPHGMSDLAVYVGAVEAMLAGDDLYGWAAPSGAGFTYPPFAAWALAPITLLDLTAQRVLWTLLQCGTAVGIAAMVAARSPWPVLARSPRSVTVPVLALLLLASYPVFSGLFLGQVSLLITALALLDALDLTPRRLRGLPTGLAAAVKLTPLVFVPYLWLTGRRRTAVAALVTSTAATALGGLLLPEESRSYWTSSVTARDFIRLEQADNVSLVGWLARSGWPAAESTVLSAAVLVPAVLVVTALGYTRAARLHRSGEVLAGAVVVGTVGILVSPISWSHHQTFLVLAAACLVAGRRRINVAWSAAVLLLLSVPVQAVWLHVWPAGHPLTEAVPVLALAVACAVPFHSRPQDVPPLRCSFRPSG